MGSIDTRQREKHSIQKREQTAHFAFSVLLLIAWLVPATIISQAVPRAAWPLAVFTSGRTVLFFWLLFLLIFIPGISILGPFMQKTQRQKQNWLNEYGLHILARVTKRAGKNAFVIDGGGHNASFNVYLNWQDLHTGQLYSFRVNTRYSSTLRNLREGNLYPVQFDPSDLSFFVVPQ